MRRIWWTRIDIKDVMVKFILIVIVGVLMIPTSLAMISSASWVGYLFLGLIGLLTLYVIYTLLAVFYIIDDDEIAIFYCWKFYHIKFNQIKRVETYVGKTDYNMILSISNIKVKLVTSKGDIYISPSNRNEFLEVLKEKRKGITFKGK